MKILIISPHIGKTAPGIVFERLIYGLSSFHEIDLLTADYEPSIDLAKISKTIISKNTKIHPRISKFLVGLFSINPFDHFWAWKSVRKLNSLGSRDYDLVLSLLSFHNYFAFFAGLMFSKKTNLKHVVYSVDAVPAPNGWPENMFYRSGVINMISKYFCKIDAFFSSNQQMLEYQLKLFVPKTDMVSGVIYNPGMINNIEFPNNESSSNNFVYTGGIYGVRKVSYLLEAFEKLLITHIESKLIFVGSQIEEIYLSSLKSETRNRIEIVPFAKDLSEYYCKAAALIDIDADIENDVFLSSKITNYIMVNRIIISQTGDNSPSRHIFSGISSVIQCEHNAIQLYEAMKKAILLKESTQYLDRVLVQEIFDVGNIVNKLNVDLERIVITK